MPILLRLFLIGICFYSHEGLAQSRLNPGAHMHGLAQMTVLYEAGQLLIELETPAVNMLGFEHISQNTEQWQQLSQLGKNLNAPQNIIGLQPSCTIQSVKVELPFQGRDAIRKIIQQPTTEKSAHHDNRENTHKDHTDTEFGYDERAHDAHQDIHVNYEWRCTGSPPPIIRLYLFSLYPSFDKIQAQWVANGKQGAKALNRNHAALEIKP